MPQVSMPCQTFRLNFQNGESIYERTLKKPIYEAWRFFVSATPHARTKNTRRIFFYDAINFDTLVKNPGCWASFLNLQVTVINQNLNDSMLCLLANPIFCEFINFNRQLFLSYSIKSPNMESEIFKAPLHPQKSGSSTARIRTSPYSSNSFSRNLSIPAILEPPPAI